MKYILLFVMLCISFIKVQAQCNVGGAVVSSIVNEPYYGNVYYLDNGYAKLGIALEWGGAITHISAPGAGITNMVCNFDHGMQIVPDVYLPPDYYSKNGNYADDQFTFGRYNVTLATQSTASINDVIVNTSTVTQTIIYNVTPQGVAGACIGATQQVTVSVNPKPSISTNSLQIVCNGSPLNVFIATNIATTGYNWGVTSQTGVTGGTTGNTTNTINDILTGVGFATYTVMATSPALCASNPLTVNVNVTSGIVILSAATKTICSGNAVNQTVTPSTAGINYNWVASNNPLTTGESLIPINTSTISDVLNITNGGQTNVTYTVTATLAGCPNATQILTITVNPLPNVSFTISDDTLCQTACVNVSSTSSVTGGSISNYQWNFGNGATSQLINPTYCYPAVGSYTISLTATSNNNCSATNLSPMPLVVFPNAIADFNFNPQSPIATSTSINFNNNSSNAINYNWNYGDGNSSVLANPTYAYNTNGIFIITLVAYNQWGCNDTVQKSIEVKTPIFIPTAFTPDGDPKNENFVILGIENYPDNELKVFNRWGNLVYSKKQYDNSWGGFTNVGSPAIGTGKLPASTYYYILEFNKENMKPATGFIVIQY